MATSSIFKENRIQLHAHIHIYMPAEHHILKVGFLNVEKSQNQMDKLKHCTHTSGVPAVAHGHTHDTAD